MSSLRLSAFCAPPRPGPRWLRGPRGCGGLFVGWAGPMDMICSGGGAGGLAGCLFNPAPPHHPRRPPSPLVSPCLSFILLFSRLQRDWRCLHSMDGPGVAWRGLAYRCEQTLGAPTPCVAAYLARPSACLAVCLSVRLSTSVRGASPRPGRAASLA